MHEYEFRLVVQHSSSFEPFFQKFGYLTQKKVVLYVKPHFRFKNNAWETKRIESISSVYHDNLWFKWVHSIETPYRHWNQSTCENFLHQVGNFQDPFTVETRQFVQIDSQAQLYSFKSGLHYKLIFEWEYGTFKKPLKNAKATTRSLYKYKHIYDAMKQYSVPSYELNENPVRKTVTCVSEILEGDQYLYAHKLDGIFGLVYSYSNRVKEKWENYECKTHSDTTLGDGFVFAAEKLESGEVFLLDVYQVRGHDTVSWCRRDILLNFLPQLKLIKGYFIQKYVLNKNDLVHPSFKTDGIIIHDVEKDTIYKYKTNHSVDLVYFKNYFHLPNGRIKCLEKDLEDGCVYEISIANGRVVRKRTDRFKGNSVTQLDNVFSYGWHGPKIEYNN